MQRIAEQRIGVGKFDDTSQIHDGDAMADVSCHRR